jgi:hypothetical protein
MYPWKDILASIDRTKMRIDALGIVTMLGSQEINDSVGRLIQSYFEFLPLLGAFVLASDQFRTKTPGFTLYNISRGFKTTELAPWLSRWLKAQDFHQIHHQVEWTVLETTVSKRFNIGPLALGFLLNSILITMAILSGDWWGFANVMSMLVSVIVKVLLLRQNRLGIDNTVEKEQNMKKERNTAKAVEPKEAKKVNVTSGYGQDFDAGRGSTGDLDNISTLLVIMDDSKAITMKAPDYLIVPVFASTSKIPNPRWYTTMRWIGWAAFAVQVVSLGMSTFLVQACTVVLLLVSSVLTIFKCGCADSTIWKTLASTWRHKGLDVEYDPIHNMTCTIGSRLQAKCSRFCISMPYLNGSTSAQAEKATGTGVVIEKPAYDIGLDKQEPPHKTTRRQDLYVWLQLSEHQEQSMQKWDMFPHAATSKDWWKEYSEKREKYQEKSGIIYQV